MDERMRWMKRLVKAMRAVSGNGRRGVGWREWMRQKRVGELLAIARARSAATRSGDGDAGRVRVCLSGKREREKISA